MSATTDFVELVLQARDKAHIAHWGSRSYARHVALGEFYEAITDLIDSFVEQYQGAYNKLLQLEIPGDSGLNIEALLAAHVAWIEAHRSKVCEDGDTSLQNTIDEIVRQYQTTLYKLNFLK